MTYTRKNQGVCSRYTTVTLENGIIQDIEIHLGCNGNLKGIQSLLIGQNAKEVIPKLRGITCDSRSSSCPDQISKCLEEALAQQNTAEN